MSKVRAGRRVVEETKPDIHSIIGLGSFRLPLTRAIGAWDVVKLWKYD